MSGTIFKQVQKQTSISAPKGIIYGPPGIGKTTFGAQPEHSLIVDCENGAGTIKCNRTPYLSTWQEISEWLNALEKEQHEYKTVVIDSLDWMLRRLEEHVSGCATGDKALEKTLHKSHGGYGNGKQVLKNYLYALLLPQLNRIVDRGIALILLAHARRVNVVDVDGVSIEKTSPDINEEYLPVFVEWSDFICLARLGTDNQRVLVTQDSARAVAKNRYSLPSAIHFDWNSFIAAIGEGLKSKTAA